MAALVGHRRVARGVRALDLLPDDGAVVPRRNVRLPDVGGNQWHTKHTDPCAS